jgi:hypothetical protein
LDEIYIFFYCRRGSVSEVEEESWGMVLWRYDKITLALRSVSLLLRAHIKETLYLFNLTGG